jgi:hypothetical protein
MKNLFLFFVAALVLSSCGGAGQADELTELVKGTCECSSEMVAFAAEMKEAASDPAKMQELMAKGQEMQTKAEACMKEKGLEEKSNALEKKMEEELGKEEAEKKMKAAMKEHCPDMFKMMEQSGM